MSQAAVMELMQRDPLVFAKVLWPDVEFYDKQRELIYSVEENDETLCVAGNMLGKDFAAAFIAIRYVLSHHPVRVVTTSVKDDHLRVLWGEIGRFIQSSKIPLTVDKGGPLIVNHRDIRKMHKGEQCPVSYLRGMVSEKGEGLSGHHAPYALLIADEASGIDDMVYAAGQGWMKRFLAIGNPNPCQNFFRRGVKAGDLLAANEVKPDHIL